MRDDGSRKIREREQKDDVCSHEHGEQCIVDVHERVRNKCEQHDQNRQQNRRRLQMGNQVTGEHSPDQRAGNTGQGSFNGFIERRLQHQQRSHRNPVTARNLHSAINLCTDSQYDCKANAEVKDRISRRVDCQHASKTGGHAFSKCFLLGQRVLDEGVDVCS